MNLGSFAAPPVHSLFFRGRPPTVARLVVPVRVDAIQALSFRSLAHVLQERSERAPASAHRDSPAAVNVVAVGLRIRAALKHAATSRPSPIRLSLIASPHGNIASVPATPPHGGSALASDPSQMSSARADQPTKPCRHRRRGSRTTRPGGVRAKRRSRHLDTASAKDGRRTRTGPAWGADDGGLR